MLIALGPSSMGGQPVNVVVNEVDTKNKAIKDFYIGLYFPRTRSLALAEGWNVKFEGFINRNDSGFTSKLETGAELVFKLRDEGTLRGDSYGKGYMGDILRHEMVLRVKKQEGK